MAEETHAVHTAEGEGWPPRDEPEAQPEQAENTRRYVLYKPSAAMVMRLENNFVYHPPKPNQIPRFDMLRQLQREFAGNLVVMCPDSRELSNALTALDEVIFHANAAIARNE